MQLSDLRKELFGYKKEDVHRYFTELSDSFSERLKKSDESNVQRIEVLERRNADLEARLEMLQAERDTLKARELAVADSIIEAQKYAEKIKEEINASSREHRANLKKNMEIGLDKAKALIDSIDECRAAVASQLSKISDEMNNMHQDADAFVNQANEVIENIDRDDRNYVHFESKE